MSDVLSRGELEKAKLRDFNMTVENGVRTDWIRITKEEYDRLIVTIEAAWKSAMIDFDEATAQALQHKEQRTRADRLEAQCAELSGLLVETSSWGHPPGLTVEEWQALLLRVAAAVTCWEASHGRA